MVNLDSKRRTGLTEAWEGKACGGLTRRMYENRSKETNPALRSTEVKGQQEMTSDGSSDE